MKPNTMNETMYVDLDLYVGLACYFQKGYDIFTLSVGSLEPI